MGALRDVLDLRPQTYGTASSGDVHDPVVEPLWAGLRILAAVERTGDATEVILLDDGQPATGFAPTRAALDDAIQADSAILDGLMVKPGRYDDNMSDPLGALVPSKTELLTQSMIGKRKSRRGRAMERDDDVRDSRVFRPDEPAIFVVVDLLALDDQSLLDVPLLERKRLLESILTDVDGVRRGAYVRPPIGSWVGSWRSQGFGGLVFKSANGRYRPGGAKDDWVSVPMPSR